jgi:hypothetical protein
MVGFACAVAADTARTGVPRLIADALREDALRVAVAGPAASTPETGAAIAAAPTVAPEPVEAAAADPGAGA